MGYDGTLKFDTRVDHSGFQSGIDKIAGIANTGLKTTLAVIGGAATAIAGMGTAAIKVGSDFESSMSNVAAISGATGKDLEALTGKAEEMGAKTKFSATESAEAFGYMAMAGWKTADMLDGIEGIMNLAAASGEDLATTSDIVTDALTAFGMSASDSTHFADVLAAASSNANTNVSMMGETFKYVAPLAGALGFSAEDCGTAIGLMANAGIKASQAGTSLRSIFTRMAKPTKEVSSAMKELGLSLTKENGEMKSLNEIMLDLRKGFSGLTEDQKAQMAATIGGQEAMSGLLAIVNASDDDFNKLQESIYGCDDAAAKMAETMQDNLAGQITILKSAIEGLGIALYKDLQNPMKNVVKEAQTMVQEVTTAYKDGGLDGMVKKTGEVLADVVVEIANAVPTLVDTALVLCQSFANSILENKEKVAEAGVKLVTSLVTAVLGFTGDFWSLAVELIAEFISGMAEQSPKIGEQAGKMVSQLSSALIENIPVIIEAGKEFVNGFLEGMSEELPGISALLSGFFDGYLSTLEFIANRVVDAISLLFNAINNGDPKTLESIGKAIGIIAASIYGLSVAGKVVSGVQSLISILGTLKGMTSGVIGVVGKAVEGFALWSGGAGTLGEVIALQFPKIAALGTNISSMVSAVKASIGTISGIGSVIGGAILAVSNFVDMFKNGFSVVKDILMGVGIAIAAVGAVILGAPATVAAVIAGIVFAVANLAIAIKENWEQISEAIQQIPEKIGEFVENAVNYLSELPGRISEFLSQIILKVQQWGANLLKSASNAVSTAVNAVAQFFNDLPYKIGYALGYSLVKMVEFGINSINWVKTNVPIIIDNIVLFFSELPGKVQKWLHETLLNLIEWGTNMLSNARTAAINTITTIVDNFSQLPEKLHTWLQNTIQKIVQWGINLAEKGRQSAADLVSSVVNGVSSLPSKMYEIGANIVSGVWNGIQSAAGWFKSSVRSFFSGIVDGAKAALGIHSPSKVFADEIGKWIPPGIGKGIKSEMPTLIRDTQSEMEKLSKKMKTAVQIETGTIKIEKNANETYKVQQENGQSFDESKTEVLINGEIHTHVELDGEEIGKSQTPIIDKNMGRIDTHKKRGG